MMVGNIYEPVFISLCLLKTAIIVAISFHFYFMLCPIVASIGP